MNRLTNLAQEARSLSIEGRAFIGGKFTECESGATIERISTADGKPLPALAACNEADVDGGVRSEHGSCMQGSWAGASLKRKKEVMFRLAELMESHRKELALLDTLETGRSFKNYFYDSIPKSIEALRYFTEALDKHYGLSYSADPGSIAYIANEPLGVVGLITPWNDPLVVGMWKIAPSLLMGNSVIVKPAEQSSFSVLMVASLAQEAGLPDGVMNVVPGLGEIAGKALAIHNDVRGLFFTGSSETGKKILTYSGQSNMKKVGLECGGKSPFIVTENCQRIREAAKVLARNIFYNQGQICSAPSRAIVHVSKKSELLGYLKEEAAKYVPSDPFNADNEVGCVVSRDQKDRIDAYIDSAVRSGLRCHIAEPRDDWPDRACCVLPTIVELEKVDSNIATEEIFGPVLALITVENTSDAVRIANDSHFGLAASVWSDSLSEAHAVARQLQAGIVHVNAYGDDDNAVPFGGIKESGIGKDKSIKAFDEYSYCKSTWIQHGELN